jgi:putative oxidoreductase
LNNYNNFIIPFFAFYTIFSPILHSFLREYTGVRRINYFNIHHPMMHKNGCGVSQHVPRVLLSLVFIVGGLGFVTNFAGTTKYVAMGLTPWGLASIATVATLIAIVLKLGGGLMLLANYRTSQAAWMLIAFSLLATVMYHTNWGGEGGQMQMTAFLKNLAIIGGLLLYADCFCKQCKVKESEA